MRNDWRAVKDGKDRVWVGAECVKWEFHNCTQSLGGLPKIKVRVSLQELKLCHIHWNQPRLAGQRGMCQPQCTSLRSFHLGDTSRGYFPEWLSHCWFIIIIFTITIYHYNLLCLLLKACSGRSKAGLVGAKVLSWPCKGTAESSSVPPLFPVRHTHTPHVMSCS